MAHTNTASLTHQLTVYETASFAADTFSADMMRSLAQTYPHQLTINAPTPLNGNQWHIRSNGWVGAIPLTQRRQLLIQPAFPLRNLFQMAERAFRLPPFEQPWSIQLDAIPVFIAAFADQFVKLVSARVRRGIYRSYVPHEERLPTIRGRIMPAFWARPQPTTTVDCRHHQLTADNVDNQLLLFAIDRLRQSTALPLATRQRLNACHRQLDSTISQRSFTPADFQHQPTNRLNSDYANMHSLAFFLLTQQAPALTVGNYQLGAFLIHLPSLFERFVAVWLADHLPNRYRLVAQEQLSSLDGALRSSIDLVLYDESAELGPVASPHAVLDTKFKAAHHPSPQDIYQITYYARHKQASNAILIYPTPLVRPLHANEGGLLVRSLTFDCTGDLDAAGHRFIHKLLS